MKMVAIDHRTHDNQRFEAFVEEKDILRIFTINNITVGNPLERAILLKDAAEKLTDLYGGDFQVLLKKSGNYLLHKNNSGILQRLKVFKAYEDPLMKKSFLLVKILKRQNYLQVKDIHNLRVL